ncbi:MAG: class I SAM-dependent methyltransferase [Fimbriimonadaceae bacterium]|nr:class I SAM-dependent methyltransferase [Fimbriimonadaceae bacterium]
MASFGPVAPFYDDLMRQVPYRMWVGYYLLLLSIQDVKPKRMLDVCCGTGTLCEMLTNENFQLEGFDLSAEMIEQARRKAAHKGLNIRYEVMDAAVADMGKQYDAAFSFFDSLNYIYDPVQLRKAIIQVGKHIRPGGSFIFDVNTEFAFTENMFDQRELSKRAKVRYDWKSQYDKVTKIVKVDMTFWYQGEPYYETHIQRAYSDAELRGMLYEAGFEKVQAYHSYTLEKPRKNSDRLHYTAIKT